MDLNRTAAATSWESAVQTAFEETLLTFAIEGAVMADESGFLLSSNPGCAEAERLAAMAPLAAMNAVAPHRKGDAPTLTRGFDAGRGALFLGLVGDQDRCEAAMGPLVDRLVEAMRRPVL
ncbi:MAG: hypothetical protein JXX28_08140 [Deltaproteobacteria bacterium]|nr:hypothetical protein [Deltaproteobacteria bacterium]